MITKEYMQKELARRIAGIRPNVPTNTDVLIGELKSVLVMVDCLPDDQPLPEDTALFNRGVAEGRRLEREENLDRDNVYWKGIQYAKEQMLKDGLDAVKTLDFNKVEKTIAGVFVKYGMDRQKEIMSNGDYEKIKRLLSIAFMDYLDSNRPFGKMCLSNGECKNIDDAFDNQDWSELCRYADKMLEMNELGNTPADKDYRPSGIQNDLSEGQIKAVELKGGTIVTEKLAKAIEKKSLLEKTIFENALAAYQEKLKELPPPPPGYYYAPKMGEIRQEGDQYICEGFISLEPIIKVEEK